MEKINKYIVSNQLSEQFFNIDSDIMSACDTEALRIAKEHLPNIDYGSSDNIDLVVRPLATSLALYQIMLQNLFSFQSVHTLYASVTTPEYVKTNLLKVIASSSGISVFGDDSETIYNQINFFIANNSASSQFGLNNAYFSSIPSLKRLFFADSNSEEMTRNKLSTIQLSTTEQMNFEVNGLNPVSLIDASYNRGDINRFANFLSEKKIELTGKLDVYFDAGLEYVTVSVTKTDGKYIVPDGYYIKISHETKNISIVNASETTNGIVKFSPIVYISGGEDTEILDLVSFSDCSIQSSSSTDDIVATDVAFKGFYPIMSDITVRTRQTLSQTDKELVRDTILDVISSKSGNITSISNFDIQNSIREAGVDAVVSSVFPVEMYYQANVSLSTSASFPLSTSDLVQQGGLSNNLLTTKNTTLKLREVIFETE